MPEIVEVGPMSFADFPIAARPFVPCPLRRPRAWPFAT
jgi:hypothetical protein